MSSTVKSTLSKHRIEKKKNTTVYHLKVVFLHDPTYIETSTNIVVVYTYKNLKKDNIIYQLSLTVNLTLCGSVLWHCCRNLLFTEYFSVLTLKWIIDYGCVWCSRSTSSDIRRFSPDSENQPDTKMRTSCAFLQDIV